MQGEGDWAAWKSESSLKSRLVNGLYVYEGASEKLLADGKDHEIDDYLGTDGATIKYNLDIAPVDLSKRPHFGRRLYRAILYVTDNKYADVKDAGAVFVTYLFYFGEVQ